MVCGGRNFTNATFAHDTLNELLRRYHFTALIEGGARGADTIARHWATLSGLRVITMPADWQKHGKGAGSIRNAAMLALSPDAVIAFPGGPGTANCVRQANALGIPVLHFSPAPEPSR